MEPKKFTIEDVVEQLIGKIRPVGETHEDNRRLENLETMCAAVLGLVTAKLIPVATLPGPKVDIRASIQESRNLARRKLKLIADEIAFALEEM